jgi:hypothetical protein
MGMNNSTGRQDMATKKQRVRCIQCDWQEAGIDPLTLNAHGYEHERATGHAVQALRTVNSAAHESNVTRKWSK